MLCCGGAPTHAVLCCAVLHDAPWWRAGADAACCVQAGGLQPALIQRLLRESNQVAMLIDALLLISQLARCNKGAVNTYEPLAHAQIFPSIRK
jgi:hypothetical protein